MKDLFLQKKIHTLENSTEGLRNTADMLAQKPVLASNE